MAYPEHNEVYTLYEMLKSLDLPDCPFLQFFYKNVECVIQTSHISTENLLKIPGMSESKWPILLHIIMASKPYKEQNPTPRGSPPLI